MQAEVGARVCAFFRIQELYFPLYYAFMQGAGFCADKRNDLKDRLERGLLAAELVHEKWNKRVWQRPRHLPGGPCWFWRYGLCEAGRVRERAGRWVRGGWG